MHQPRALPLLSLQLALKAMSSCSMPISANFPRSFRTTSSWSLRRSVTVSNLRLSSGCGVATERRVSSHHSLSSHRVPSGNPSVKTIWLDPVPNAIVGDIERWAQEACVEPARIPGHWIDKHGYDTPAELKAASDEKVILFFRSKGRSNDATYPKKETLNLPHAILSQCRSAKRALAVEYRLCDLSPVYRNPFPAALLDAIAGYCYLVDTVGASPSNIILLGDSSGGHLALALARYIATNALQLSRAMRNMPYLSPDYAMVLLSPWCDLGTSHQTPGSAMLNHSYDFLADLSNGVFAAARGAYGDPLGFSAADTNPYLSPASLYAHAPFVGFPRTFIELGRSDRVVNMCRTLRDRMIRDMGKERVAYRERKYMIPHRHPSLLALEESPNMELPKAIAAWLAEGTQ